MTQRIQVRRGTAAAATAANPVLASGEIGYETDTNKLKVGDGTTAWNSLPYFGAAADLSAHLTDTSDAHDASAISFAPTGGIAATDVQAALAELDAEKAASAATGATVRRSAALSIPNATVTAVPWTVEVVDTNGFHDNATNPERLTVPTGLGGLYLITLTAELFGSSSTGERTVMVRKGTGQYLTIDTRQGVATTFTRYALSVTESLSPGDYVTASVYQATGTADNWRHAYSGLDADGFIKFSMYRLGT